MIQLYQSMQSVCSGKVRLVLEEKGAEYEEIDVDLQKGEQFDPDYMKLNPKAVVPTIIHDGKVIRESTVMIEYLDQVFPEPPLKPEDPYLTFRMRLFPKMMDEEVHPAVNLITYAVAPVISAPPITRRKNWKRISPRPLMWNAPTASAWSTKKVRRRRFSPGASRPWIKC